MTAYHGSVNEDAVVRRIQAALGATRPDPLFERRLRGMVLNRHVAIREGLAVPSAARQPRVMGRLGRASLFASVAVAASVAGAAGAAQESLPGDALYPLKLQIETVRMRAAPAWLRDEMASIALGERLEELESVLIAGRWDLAHAAATAVQVSATELAVLDPTGRIVAAERIEEHLASLQALIATAPEAARHGLELAVSAAAGDPPGNAYGSGADGVRGHGNTANGSTPPDNAGGQVVGPTPGGNVADEATPEPTSTPDPTESKKPRPTPKGGGKP